MAQYDFSPEARERSRLAATASRARRDERMQSDPAYAVKIQEARREQRRKALEKNPKLHQEQRAKKLAKDPDYDRKQNAKKWEKIKADPRLTELRAQTIRKHNLKKKYGLTVEHFDQMVLDQGGCCAICVKGLELGGYKTHVDHCHESGKVRGILCFDCNTALGKLGEDEGTLLSMLEYVRKNK